MKFLGISLVFETYGYNVPYSTNPEGKPAETVGADDHVTAASKYMQHKVFKITIFQDV